jgi:hypothetical protein
MLKSAPFLLLAALALAPPGAVAAQPITGEEAVFEEIAENVYAYIGRRNN